MISERTFEVPALYAVNNQLGNHVEVYEAKRKKKLFCLMLTIVALLIAILVLSGFIACYIIFYAELTPMITLCNSDECLRIAAAMKDSMDTSVDPCDDFSRYACGKWSQAHAKPDYELNYDWGNDIEHRQARAIRELLRMNLTRGVFDTEIPNSVLEAQKLFSSCIDTDSMNVQGLRPLISLLDSLNLPLVPSVLINSTVTNVIEKMARVHRVLGTDVFFGIEVVPNPINSSNNVLAIGRSVRINPFPLVHDKIVKEYLTSKLNFARKKEGGNDDQEEDNKPEMLLLTSVLREMLSFNVTEGNGKLKTIKKVTEIEDKISETAEIIYTVRKNLSENETKNSDETFESYSDVYVNDDNFMHVDQLQALTDEFVKEQNVTHEPQEIWKPFIGYLFGDILEPDWHNKTKLWIYDLGYLKKIALLFATVPEEIIETVTWWTAVQRMVPFSSKRLREAWDTYLDTTFNLEGKRSKSLSCVFAVNQLMGMATSWLYFDPLFQEETTQKIGEILDNSKQAFYELIMGTNWIDHRTKFAIAKKLSNVLLSVGYPEWMFKEGKLDEYYNNIILSDTEYLKNIVKLVSTENLRSMKNIRKENDLQEPSWLFSPVTVNAYQWDPKNEITITAGLLQFPFIDLGLQYINYGVLGASIIGHELSHSFDNVGRKYDANGNFKQWWPKETIATYRKKFSCLIKHYNDYFVEEANGHVNGLATLNENIADVVGMKLSITAYKKWKSEYGIEPLLPGFINYTNEQLLFLSYATTWCETTTPLYSQFMLKDEHAPNHVRILGVLRNLKEFSDAWNCSTGSNMNPSTRCELW